MGSIVGNSLDLIRTVFNRNNVLPLPSTYWDAAARGSFFMQGYGLGPMTGSNSQIADSVRLEEDLMTRYADYDEMDQFPELGAAIDLFADDATVQDVMTGKSMWFESDDETVDHILNDMLDVNLKVENELWEIARSLCKYGNEFIEPIVLDQVGVVKLNHVPPPWMRRIEDINGILYGYMQDPAMQFSIDTRSFLERVKNKGATQMELPVNMGQGWLQVYEPWEIVHMRLRSRARRDLYGYSVVEAARYAWKRLSMMEDAMLMYKVTRSPQRYAFYVDVGDVPPNQARGLLNRIKNDFKKSKFIDPNCLTGDTLIPLLDGSHKSIKELAEKFAADGQSFWVYSYDLVDDKIVPGKAVSAVLSGEKVPVYRVRLDSGAVIRCTGDHPFLLRDGTYKNADELCRGESLMPLYINELAAHGYTGVRNVHDKKNKMVHQLVAEAIYDKEYRSKGLNAHHINEIKSDNRPENIVLLTQEEHILAHDNHRERLNSARERFVKRIKEDTSFREHVYSRLENWRLRNPDWLSLSGAVEARLRKRKENEKLDQDIYCEILKIIEDILIHNEKINSEDLCDELNERLDFIKLWNNLSEGRKEKIDPTSLVYVFTRNDIKGLDGMKQKVIGAVKRSLKFDGQHKKDPSEFLNKDDEFIWKAVFSIIERIVRLDPLVCSEELCDRLNANEEFHDLRKRFSGKRVEIIKPSNVMYLFKRNGYAGLSGFKKEIFGKCSRRSEGLKKNGYKNNHKVVEVVFAGYEDVYDLTVDEYHNFGLTAGVFVHNTGKPSFRYSPLSAEDDFFIPVRKERKGTEIEVLAGPEGQSVEDVEYFLNKIFAALKIPKSYLGADETVGRANLSQLDSRMCRSVMRIQRELKNGFRQIARVDLAAKNIDPDRTSFECHMVIPSGVFELAQIEVEKAKLDLASSYKDANFSQYWIYSKILGLTDEEILQIQKQRAVESQGDFTAEDVGLIHDRLPRMVERLSTDYDKRADRHQKKILDEIESGNTAIGRRLRELKHLTQEIKSGIRNQQRVNGRRK